MKWDTLSMLTFALVIIGGINWGLVGLFDFNLVTMLTGFLPGLDRIVYILVGLSALYAGYMASKMKGKKKK